MRSEMLDCQSRNALVPSHHDALPATRVPIRMLGGAPIAATHARQKREDPIVFPRPGLLVCRKEGLDRTVASEVPRPAFGSPRRYAQFAVRARREPDTT